MKAEKLASVGFGMEFVPLLLWVLWDAVNDILPSPNLPSLLSAHTNGKSHPLPTTAAAQSLFHTCRWWKRRAHFLASDLPPLQTQDTEIHSKVPLKAPPSISRENSKKEDAGFINPMD